MAIFGSILPEATHNEKETEFFSLKQGGKTVTKYKMKFSALARLAFSQLIDDVLKAAHFEVGL